MEVVMEVAREVAIMVVKAVAMEVGMVVSFRELCIPFYTVGGIIKMAVDNSHFIV